MENKHQSTEDKAPEWLKILQENSWELELLISGGAIFTLFQLSAYWVESIVTMSTSFPIPGMSLFLMIGALGIEVLKIGFIFHLILRAFWISIVCLNYAYPQGINEAKVKREKPFRFKKNGEKGLNSSIVNVDRICGLTMFLSISSTFILAGLMFSIFFTVSLPALLGIDLGFLNIVLFVAAIVYFIDFIAFGLLRNIPYFSYVIYPFFAFFDFISFRIFFSKSFLLLFTNISKWKFTLAISVYLVFAVAFSYQNIFRIMHWPNIFDRRGYKWEMAPGDYIGSSIYKDQLDDNSNSSFHIQSKIIKDNFIELFIRYDYRFDETMNLSNRIEKLEFLSQLIAVQIDDVIIEGIEWHPTWTNNTTNIGITAMIPIKDLGYGKHVLIFGIKPEIMDKIIKDKSLDVEYIEHLKNNTKYERIPFWKNS